MNTTTIFQALSDETRLRAVTLIAAHGELCVCELTEALDVAQPKISRHVATLREAGILTSRRDAQWVFYALDPDLPDWAQSAIAAAIAGSRHDPAHVHDNDRLAAMHNRPDRCRVA